MMYAIQKQGFDKRDLILERDLDGTFRVIGQGFDSEAVRCLVARADLSMLSKVVVTESHLNRVRGAVEKLLSGYITLRNGKGISITTEEFTDALIAELR